MPGECKDPHYFRLVLTRTEPKDFIPQVSFNTTTLTSYCRNTLGNCFQGELLIQACTLGNSWSSVCTQKTLKEKPSHPTCARDPKEILRLLSMAGVFFNMGHCWGTCILGRYAHVGWLSGALFRGKEPLGQAILKEVFPGCHVLLYQV